MELPITHPAFQTTRLAVETAGFFRGPRLLVNDVPAERTKRKYIVRSDNGTNVTIELKANFLDSIPKVKVGDDMLNVARPLTWYEYVWLGIPILLVFTGGALGAFVGIFAVYSSARVFRGDRGAFAKYAVTALISVSAFVIFAVLVTALQIAFGSRSG
jgi:hypothetical protein